MLRLNIDMNNLKKGGPFRLNKVGDINIRQLFPSYVYKRGLDYYNHDRVENLSFDINFHTWSANVCGKNDDYFVEIDTSQIEKNKISTHCSCPAYATYGPCKHVAAVLLAIQNKESLSDVKEIPSFRYKVTEDFMRSISATQQTESPVEVLQNKVPLRFEYFLHRRYDKRLLLELKVGPERTFVVKDVKDFFKAILSNQSYPFTKTFTYSPEQHYVLEKDLNIVKMIHQMIESMEMSRDTYYYETNAFDRKRYVTILPLIAKQLLTSLSERDFRLKKNHTVLERIEVKDSQLPFEYQLVKNDADHLILQLEDISQIDYLPTYHLLMEKGNLYFLNAEQQPVIEQLFSVQEMKELPIAKEQADQFISEVIPSLKRVGHVHVSEDVASEIVQFPLVAKLYLDMQDGIITGDLTYHYGSEVIDPFNPNAKVKDVIIIRDVERERKIMALIEHVNFHFNGKFLYIEPDEETLYEFLYHMLPILDDYVELFLTSHLRNMMFEERVRPHTSIRIDSETNLLEIGFEMDGIDEEEIDHILKAVIEKKRYYRMPSGEMLSLEGEEISSINRFFTDLNLKHADIKAGRMTMPAYRGMQIDQLIETEKSYDTSFRKLLQHLKAPEEQVYELPDNLQAELRNYQMTGYQWFKSLSEYHFGGILADDMGLGKTLQSIAYIASEPSKLPHLIVVPSSVVYNWKNEFEKFAPTLSTIVLTGTPEERHERIEKADEIDVWITSYATLRQDIAYYRKRTFQTMILDEAQYIKNYATKTSKAVREVVATRKFALSGTPIENSIDELWAIFQVVLPGLMPNRKTFRQLDHDKVITLTKPFILRRLKTDVLKELPEKIESVYVSELTREQKELYVAYLKQLQQETAQSFKNNSFQKNRMKILAGLTRLRQLCCHPALFIENYKGHSGKLIQLMETIHHALDNGKRMLIFSQFTSMHEIIAKCLEQEGIEYFYLHGETPSKERVHMSERFNQGERDVFLISLKAGGTGLNLTGADTVILYDLWWNPAVEDQATGRAHRFGQKNIVQVIRLIAEGTIEEKIYELQQKKRELIDQIIKPGEKMLSSLSEDDIREILKV